MPFDISPRIHTLMVIRLSDGLMRGRGLNEMEGGLMFIRRLSTLVVFMLALAACKKEEKVTYVSPALAPRPAPTVQGSTGLSQESFDLQTAIALLRTNKVKDAQSLEAAINEGGSGINNVDIDGDGKTDYVAIQETVSGAERHLSFMACPSSKQGEPVKIASVTVRDAGQQVYVGGGYTSLVSGYDSVYYSYYVPRMSLGDALFLSWMLSPRPLWVYRPYAYYGGWAPRPVLAAATLRTTRTTYTTQTRVAPVAKAAPPANYASTAAVKAPSRFAAPKAGTGLSGTAGKMRDYRVDTGSKPSGTAFGARPAAPSAVSRPSSFGGSSAARPSTSWGGGSRTSFGGSRTGYSSRRR
ncbi:MAG: hypothetical protein HYY84_16470 [Deltaproteobacteria bacterium]|nr:hypothetical protein [Deltaproteobacteria bacterium]